MFIYPADAGWFIFVNHFLMEYIKLSSNEILLCFVHNLIIYLQNNYYSTMKDKKRVVDIVLTNSIGGSRRYCLGCIRISISEFFLTVL